MICMINICLNGIREVNKEWRDFDIPKVIESQSMVNGMILQLNERVAKSPNDR